MSQVRPIEDLFAELLELTSPAEREAYLTENCGQDPALQQQLQKLLAANEKAGSFLRDEQSVEATVDVDPNSRLIGSTIGPYKLREVIGEGGMGTVYVAEQEKPLRRKVALKVIKAGMDSKAVIARFEAERNALALMNHPNIAKVLDAGSTEQGRPFFAMELVSGIPITDYCDEHKLSIAQRLELFVQVCQAIQHAHLKGIIHRDIKPTNVLVTELDGKPVPKVIDFGVAKALNQSLTDRSIYTGFQSVIGTPLYMSPEQASLSGADVDTRSDVYSLGVLLYELLTGTTPLEHSKLHEAAQHEVLRIIREEEPPRPSNRISTLGKTAARISQQRQTQPERLGRLVKGDLDWIVMTALAKERSRRYKTADALAEDVHSYLASETVAARPPSTTYRLRKFAKRNRTAVGAGLLVLTAFLVSFASIAWFAIETQQHLAKLQETVFRDIFHNALLSGGIDKTATSQAADALTEEQQNALDGLDAFYNGRPDDAIQYLDKGVETPSTMAIKAWCYVTIGSDQECVQTVSRLRGLPVDTAEDHLMVAQLYSWLRPEEALEHVQKARQRSDIGVIGQLAEALAHANLALRTSDEAMAIDAVEVFEAGQRLYPKNKFIRDQIVFVKGAAGLVYHANGKDAVGDEYVSQAIQAAEEFLDKEGTPASHHASLLANVGRYEKALELFEKVLEKNPSHWMAYYVATACLAGQQPRALKFVEKMDRDNFYAKLGRALLYADDPTRRGDVEAFVQEIFESKTDSDARLKALEALLMARVSDSEVATIAGEIIGNTGDFAATVDAFFPIKAIDYLAKPNPVSDAEIRRIDMASMQVSAIYETGLRYYARGEFDLAMRYLREAKQRSEFGASRLWSEYLIKKSTRSKEPRNHESMSKAEVDGLVRDNLHSVGY